MSVALSLDADVAFAESSVPRADKLEMSTLGQTSGAQEAELMWGGQAPRGPREVCPGVVTGLRV